MSGPLIALIALCATNLVVVLTAAFKLGGRLASLETSVKPMERVPVDLAELKSSFTAHASSDDKNFARIERAITNS